MRSFEELVDEVDDSYELEERAAILEFDAGMTREEAERRVVELSTLDGDGGRT